MHEAMNECPYIINSTTDCMMVLLICSLIFLALIFLIERGKLFYFKYQEMSNKVKFNAGETHTVIENNHLQGKNVIETKELVKVYDKVQAVKGVDLQLKENEILGILGPNGAGKSSTFNMLTL
mmetsp:Transcript_34187/g.33386  ORF Transcript_34187/g.33386 Transcript_34187/m.33386 type:complete len:123 (+) Transcript_34187:37-405(+)